MDLQFGLAIVDQVNGGKETRQRMEGWMHGESKVVRRLRTISATALIALAERLDPAQRVPGPQAPTPAKA